MIIECSNCTRKFKIQEDLLPKDKVVVFPCKNCGENFRLDFRTEKSISEKSGMIEPDDTDSAANSQPGNETAEISLKDQILKDVKELPPMPQVVVKTRELMADSNVDTKKIASVIETDQGIATKVLKVANSSYYGLSGKISSISHALVVLGHGVLEEVVTLAGTEGILAGKLPGYGYDSADLWKHSLAVALGSKMLSDPKNADLVKQAHMAGLIHDVGKIILDSYIIEKKEEIESFMEKEEKTFLDAETQYFGFNHADIASEVCKKWNFPGSINAAIKFHHQPGRSDGNELAYILHIADYIAIMGGIGYDNDDIIYELEKGAMDHINLKTEDMSDIVLKITDSVNQISI